MTIRNDRGIEETVARGIPLDEALKIAIEHDGAGEAAFFARDVGTKHFISIGRWCEDGSYECLAFEVMQRAILPGLNEACARRAFERKLLDNTGAFWSGRVESDGDYVRRHGEESAT